MMSASQRSDFKKSVKSGKPTFGLFLDSSSPLIAEQIGHLGYDYVLASLGLLHALEAVLGSTCQPDAAADHLPPSTCPHAVPPTPPPNT